MQIDTPVISIICYVYLSHTHTHALNLSRIPSCEKTHNLYSSQPPLYFISLSQSFPLISAAICAANLPLSLSTRSTSSTRLKPSIETKSKIYRSKEVQSLLHSLVLPLNWPIVCDLALSPPSPPSSQRLLL